MRLHSIFTRVFLSFWATIVLIIAAAVTVTALNFATNPQNPEVVTRRAAEVLEREGLIGLRAWLAERNRRQPRQRTLIIDESGQDILGQRLPARRGFRRRPSADRTDGPPAQEPRPWRGASFVRSGQTFQGPDGSRYLVIFDPPVRRGPLSTPFSWPVRMMLLVLAIGISGLASYLLARSISTPLRQLKTTTRTFSTGDLTARTPAEIAERKDELGLLAREFDSMAERLNALVTARQQLLRDISHELRSPLARLQMAVGLARQDRTTADVQLERIEREAERLERLIASILEYARLERDPATLAMESVDLAGILREIVHDARFESQRSAAQLRFDHAGEVMIRADAQVLHAAIDNVIRNALIHSGNELPIEVTLTIDAREARIDVRDHGTGVPEEDLERIFEPFHRVTQGARAAREGSGVGLAIAARAVALHGGRVSARNAPDGGLVVTIVLPRGT